MSTQTFTVTTALGIVLGSIVFPPATHAQTQPGTAIVKAVQGTASFIDSFGRSHPLTEGMILHEGCTIKTAAGTSVDLWLENNGRYIGLFEESTLALTKLAYQPSRLGHVFDTQLHLKAGRMLASVSKLLPGARYELKTPQGIATVRGTDFYYDGKSGQIWVVSGLVHFEISLLDVLVTPPPGQHSIKRTMDIPAGWTLFVTREIDMINFRNGTLLPTFRGGAPVPADVIARIGATPLLGGHYRNPNNKEVTVQAAWFTTLNPKANVVNLVGLPALAVPSP